MSGELLFLAFFGGISLFCCVMVILCLVLCVKLLFSPQGISFIIIGCVLLNWGLGLVSLEGGFEILWGSIFGDWSVSGPQLVEVALPVLIAILSSIGHVYCYYACLVLCLGSLCVEVYAFSTIFTQSSLVPMIAFASSAVGVVILLLWVLLAVIIGKRIQRAHQDAKLAQGVQFNVNTDTSVAYGYYPPQQMGGAYDFQSPQNNNFQFGSGPSSFTSPPPTNTPSNSSIFNDAV